VQGWRTSPTPALTRPLTSKLETGNPNSLKDNKVRRPNPHPPALGTVQNETNHSSLSK